MGPEVEVEKLIVGHGVLARGSVGGDIVTIAVGMVCWSCQCIVCPVMDTERLEKGREGTIVGFS